ncbi:hypothetical protein [Acinetobacter populi]|uniref:Uncharacterized protein n=1 Tax=Acinetobacter populi TaxID=1582270 RepID=A0A1Z9Z1C5_9GAMM|nr:hypothetical protein [Acinetobacter populi]OUY08288.1 hypothetical protein CAP51_01310 [Acinetobacter populi]
MINYSPNSIPRKKESARAVSPWTASTAIGAVGGKFSGAIQKAPIRFAPSQFISPTEAARANRSVDWNYFLNNSNKFIGIGNVGGAVISSDPLGMNSMNFQLNQQLLQNQYDKYAYRLPIVHQLPPIVVTAETNISREFQNNVNQYMNSWK